jgi:hypothetical protein
MTLTEHHGTVGRRQPEHGTRSMYTAGCRDECCRAAERVYKRRRRAQLRAEGRRAA